ncbi:MAG: PAAR domain-containing protein [Selenomonadaceae bacterium]|nr:PAAR domain-containing protein [Selenomonadaceae bacterium]
MNATRLGDNCSGHDACSPRPLISASENVFVNGLGAGRVGDQYASHSCTEHPSHNDHIAAGSSTVFINGKNAGRIGDAVSIGGTVAQGSDNVFIGG